MPRWIHTVDIKRFMNNERMTPVQTVSEIAEVIGASPLFEDEDFAERLRAELQFHQDALCAGEAEPDDLLEAVDEILSEIYDFADENGIWLGP